jgi:hypothetical protein
MKERTLEYMEEMEQTGAGIQHEGDINMDDLNSFTMKWGMYIISWHLGPDVPPLTSHFILSPDQRGLALVL